MEASSTPPHDNEDSRENTSRVDAVRAAHSYRAVTMQTPSSMTSCAATRSVTNDKGDRIKVSGARANNFPTMGLANAIKDSNGKGSGPLSGAVAERSCYA